MRQDNAISWGTFLFVAIQTVAIIALVISVVRRKRVEGQVRRRNRELDVLNRVIAASATGQSVEEILGTACRELALAFNVSQAAAALLDEGETTATVVAEYRAEGRPSVLNEVIPVADSPAFQYLLAYKRPLVANDAQNDPRLAPAVHDIMRRRGTVSLLLLPIVIGGEVVGSLGVDAIERRHFSLQETSLAWSVADQLAGVMARARLDRERRRLSAVIEQTAESVLIMDVEGTVLSVNPAFERITGYNRSQVVGQPPYVLKGGDQGSKVYEEIWSALRVGEMWSGRLANERTDGTLYTVDTTIIPVRDEGGDIVSYVAIQHDVTRELHLEERYLQAQKMEAVGRLAGGVAHDFNNVLTAIQGYTALLLREFTSGDLSRAEPVQEHKRQEIRADLGEIERAAARAAALTQQLLAFGRRQVLQPRVLDLNVVVSEIRKMFERLIGEDIELHVDLEPSLWRVKADPGQIGQVIMNLVVNARDAMPEGGSLTVETENVLLDASYTQSPPETIPGRYVMLAISDTGIGMDEEVRSHLFEPFFTTKEVGKGTGLGLSTVHGIVKQSGGHVEVHSEPGQGTVFKVYLPRVEEEVRPAGKQYVPDELPRGTETILLVEDEEAVRELACRILERQGYTVLVASQSQEAFLFSDRYTGTIQLLVTDVVMPGMGGRKLAERLVALRPEIKVLYVSGYADDAIVHHGVLDPDVAFLQKPFTPSTFVRRVREVLDAP